MWREAVVWCLSVIVFGASGKNILDRLEIDNEITNPFEEALIRNKLELDCGYVKVRDGVSMFWWLYYADGQIADAGDKPTILWVQGGPGLPASGIGNFMEIGPLDLDFKLRNHSWAKGQNLLLIDSPAGTGFSRAERVSDLVTKDKQIVTDLVNTVRGFLIIHPELKKSTWHIFSQSYGGKIAPKLGYRLHKEIEKGKLELNLQTVAIGSGFVDPIESISTTPDYIYHMGLIDLKDYEKLKKSTDEIVTNIKKRRYELAYSQNLKKYIGIQGISDVNKNNINQESTYKYYGVLERKINFFVKPVLNATRHDRKGWEPLNQNVYMSLSENMMLHSKRYVERLLNETSIKVVIYNGNFDAVTPMAGCINWAHKLRWPGAEEFRNKDRQLIPGELNGYYKIHENLSLWWVLGAGHWVPNDNPSAMKEILDYALGRNCHKIYYQWRKC